MVPSEGKAFGQQPAGNDTAAFVRRDSKWSLINLRNNDTVVDQVRGFKFIRDRQDDQLAIVHAGDMFGVLHNRRGTVIPLSFTDIVNLGSAEWPLFFTEKHIEEVSMYVVIYYDRDGKFVRKVGNAKWFDRLANVTVDPKGDRIYLVDVPRAAQTEFRVGYVTGLTFDATGEHYRANVMNKTHANGLSDLVRIALLAGF